MPVFAALNPNALVADAMSIPHLPYLSQLDELLVVVMNVVCKVEAQPVHLLEAQCRSVVCGREGERSHVKLDVAP